MYVRKFVADLSEYDTIDNYKLVTLSNQGIVGTYNHARIVDLVSRNVNGSNIRITPKEDNNLSKLQKQEEDCLSNYCKAKKAHVDLKMKLVGTPKYKTLNLIPQKVGYWKAAAKFIKLI